MKIRCVSAYSNGKIIDAFLNMLPEEYDPSASSWEVIGAVNNNNELMGVLAFVDEVDRFRITHLYVPEEFRRTGAATALVEELIYVNTLELFCRDIEVEITSWQEDLMAFFEDHPRFRLQPKSATHFYRADQVLKAPLVEKLAGRKEGQAKAFFEQSSYVRNTLLDHMEEQGNYFIDDKAAWERACVKDLCLCTLNQAGEIDGAVFVEQIGEGHLLLSWLWCSEQKMLTLISELCRRYSKAYSEWNLAIEPVSGPGYDLAMKMLGKPEISTENYLAYFTC